jgi:hypothetical protein
MKSAKAYRRDGKWYIHSDCQTTAGVWIASAPYLASDNDPSALGGAILRALEASAIGVPHPTDWGNIFSPVLDLAGVKSWATFVKGASLVGIEANGPKIVLTPHHNQGPKEGFDPLENQHIQIPAEASVSDLGQAALNVFALCK